MLSRVSFKPLIRNFNSFNHHSKDNTWRTMKKFATGAFFGLTIGSVTYDGYNEFQICGGIARFVRSLKIAGLISVDYLVSLYGLEPETKEYEQVKKHILCFVVQINQIFFTLDFKSNTHSKCGSYIKWLSEKWWSLH